jgi:acetylornithine/succinyldiaminopimelate/putrescine aminotransferase/predicted amino acid dehydrogenase
MRAELSSAPSSETSSGRREAEHFKPRLHQLLQSLRLDIVYESGSGTSLFHRREEGQLIEVLDLVGGYGSLLLGHSHPALVAEAVKLLTERRPIHAQGSVRPLAQQLARALSHRAGGDYMAVFANSGAEAVEGAIKHALLETGGRKILALEGAFHGKTIGALQLTANPHYRDGFELSGFEVIRIPPNDIAAVEAAFTREQDLAGFIFEPIQGEGGVRPLNSAFCQCAAALCQKHRIPFIADECQTGTGRTGTFLACEQLGIRPSYIILSKALGGGLAKISALLIERSRYVDEFDLKHTSTYADDDFSCAIALKTLDLLDAAALQRCAAAGGQIRSRLDALAEQFPDIIEEVRGAGLMIGVAFRKRDSSPSLVLRYLSAQDDLLFVLAGYLWHAHRIRVAPTLSDRWTLRLEPALMISPEEIDRILEALNDVCERLRNHDALGLTSFLAKSPPVQARPVVRTDPTPFAYQAAQFWQRERNSRARRVAWLCHFIDSDDFNSLEPSFASLSTAAREWYLERGVPRAGPVIMGGVEIHSRTGSSVWMCPILLPFTSKWAKGQLDAGDAGPAAALVQSAIDLAHQLRCEIAALGQYTSIVTRNGTRLEGHGICITTGNSYALALAIQALEQAQRKLGRRPADSTLAVVGAAGNIGRAAAEFLAPFYRETVLVGRSQPSSIRRIKAIAATVPRARIASSLVAVASADAVLVATNAVDAPLRATDFKREAIVCDVSVPAAIGPEVKSQRPDLVLIKGGIAALPGGEDLELPGFPLPHGQTYGCMAEAMLLGFGPMPDLRFTGSISARHLHCMTSLAEQHGFELADYKSHCVLGFRPKEEPYAVTR